MAGGGGRYGYASSRQLADVVAGYQYANIPLETLVTDSQYMDKDQDFTFSPDFSESSMAVRVCAPLCHVEPMICLCSKERF